MSTENAQIMTSEIAENAPIHSGELHVNCKSGVGIGDLFMFTPAFAAFKRMFPGRALVVHGDSRAEDVYAGNTDIDQLCTCECPVPAGVPSMNQTVGKEGTPRLAFDLLGVGKNADSDASPYADRRMRYVVTEDEAETARQMLASLPVNDADCRDFTATIAVQMHGLWMTKRWQHTFALLRLLSLAGMRVLLMGTEAGALPPPLAAFVGKSVWDLRGRFKFRKSLALLSVCDCFVGFDSGLTFGAAAVGCPCVVLTGSHDCSALIGDMQVENLTLLRPVTPDMCFARHGKSCRKESYYGNFCPLRVVNGQMGQGCECIDAIQPETVLNEVIVYAHARHAAREETIPHFGGTGGDISAFYDFAEVKLTRPQKPVFKGQAAVQAAPVAQPAQRGGVFVPAGANPHAAHPLRRRGI